MLRILLRKLSDERHVLEVVRGDGRSERIECETRSYLCHDLLHYAVEAEARLDSGFWGTLARGRTLEQMNDRSGAAMAAAGSVMPMIEQIVGAMSAAVKGQPAEEVVASLRRNATALPWSIPAWFHVEFVAAVQERMRRLLGRWRATPFGGALELRWPE